MLGFLRYSAIAVAVGGTLVAGEANVAFGHDYGVYLDGPGISQPVYGGYVPHCHGPVIGGYAPAPVWHDASHWDYEPGFAWQHGDHFHVEPGHHVWHETGHWHD